MQFNIHNILKALGVIS